jgi:hypothetical protein
MAIIIAEAPPQDKTVMAYNNQILKFGTNSSFSPVRAVISVGSFNATIYPQPNGQFYFNLIEIAKSLVNTNNFADNINPDLPPYEYNGSNVYFSGVLNISLVLANATFETLNRDITLLAGVQQLESYKKGEVFEGTYCILLPLFPKSNDRFYARYFEGYPFDVSFLDKTQNDIIIENETNLLNWSFDSAGIVTRIFFSDGRIDETIDDVLPISLGRNVLEWEGLRLIIDKVDSCDGVYLKWFNPLGGYSYWLFPKFSQRTLTTNNIGKLDNDFETLENTSSPQVSLGREGRERISLDSDLLTPEKFNLLKTIYTSPKVYLFTGEPYSQASSKDWIEVSIVNTQHRTRNWKGQPLNVTLEIELPEMNTQKI